MKPRDVALLIDRLQLLFDRPSSISQHQGLTVTSEVTPDALSEFIEASRGCEGQPGWTCHRCRELRVGWTTELRPLGRRSEPGGRDQVYATSLSCKR
jgi:hypothetical protein